MFKKILSCVGLRVTCRISVTKLHSTPQTRGSAVEIHNFIDAKGDAFQCCPSVTFLSGPLCLWNGSSAGVISAAFRAVLISHRRFLLGHFSGFTPECAT